MKVYELIKVELPLANVTNRVEQTDSKKIVEVLLATGETYKSKEQCKREQNKNPEKYGNKRWVLVPEGIQSLDPKVQKCLVFE